MLLVLWALGVASCGPHTRIENAAYPIHEVMVATDGTEAWARLESGVRIADTVKLAAKIPVFRSGVSLDEARRVFGQPEDVTRGVDGITHRFVTDGVPIEVVEVEERSSSGNETLKHVQLRVVIEDPPFSSYVAPSLRDIWQRDLRRETVSVVSTFRDDPALLFRVRGGRVQYMAIGWEHRD